MSTVPGYSAAMNHSRASTLLIALVITSSRRQYEFLVFFIETHSRVQHSIGAA